MKTVMTIDPQLISLLGRKLYSGHPVVICVRELLQNAVDACKRAQVDPKITISITSPADGLIKVSCDDNGIGMTEEELLNDFLCLGGTNKGEGETGGFGIAKAALMSGVWWQVTTLDNLVSIDDLIAGSDIRKADRRQGTLVEVVYETAMSYSVRDTSHMIYGSDVDIHYIVDTAESGILKVDDEHAGMFSTITPSVSGENWTGGLVEAIMKQDGWSEKISGRTFIRLNGLVQFMGSKSYYRANNLIIDVYTKERPTSKLYPFTISRERLVGTVEGEIVGWIDEQNENPLSSDQDTQKREPEEIGVIPGHLLKGRRAKYSEHNEDMPETTLERNVINTVRQLRNNLPSNHDNLKSYIRPNSESLMIKLVDYNVEERNVVRDSKIVTAWGEILREIVDEGVEFGVGLIGRIGTLSLVDRNNGILFFCVNPAYLGTNSDSPAGLVLSLWGKAVHEVSHVFEQRHNERFTSIELELEIVSSDGLASNIKRISKILEGIDEQTEE